VNERRAAADLDLPVIVNDDLDRAVDELLEVIRQARSRSDGRGR